MYADHVTDSMERAIRETYRRREAQIRHNEEHGITPKGIIKASARYLAAFAPGGR